MRLTNSNATKEGTTIGMPKAVKCYWKLKDLEDFEEDLGVDLITLFKALKNGIYVKIYGLVKRARIMNADIKHKTLTYITVEDWNEEWLNFIDYGKTWALTKEELE